MSDTLHAALRSLPSVDQLLQRPPVLALLREHPRPLVLSAVREAVAAARQRLLSGDSRGFDEEEITQALTRSISPGLRRVINATGVVLHTNLGRAPLADLALARIAALAGHYTNLELDLETGRRGSRYAPVEGHLCALTGAESALVVNNCAAAVLLVIAALAQGKEAVVSRGELVEIGGGFRMPDVMRQSGATLVEVGTTNRTRVGDYAEAMTEKTGLLLKVHRSNFAQVGFTEEATLSELARLGRQQDVPVFYDLGSGALVGLEGPGLTPEPSVREAVASGVEVVAFSGDKLMGGPQAGIVVGARRWLDVIRAHPLNRAVRVDKLTVAALEATLELYRTERMQEIPTVRLLTEPLEMLEARAGALSHALTSHGIAHQVVSTEGQVGGGSMPLAAPRSFACSLAAEGAESGPEKLIERLRRGVPAVLARIEDSRALFDVRCLREAELPELAGAIARARAAEIGEKDLE